MQIVERRSRVSRENRHCNRSERCGRLGYWLSPVASEWWFGPSSGLRRWLRRRMSHHAGHGALGEAGGNVNRAEASQELLVNIRPMTAQLVGVAIVAGVVAGALSALAFAEWGPFIPWILGGQRSMDSANPIPAIVTAIVTSGIISSWTRRIRALGRA